MAAEQLPTSAPEVLLHGGWATTAIVSAVAWIGRMALGRSMKVWDDKFDKIDARLEKMAEQSDRRSEVIANVDARDLSKKAVGENPIWNILLSQPLPDYASIYFQHISSMYGADPGELNSIGIGLCVKIPLQRCE